MKLKNGEIFSAKAPMQKLLEEKLPVKVSYEIAQIANKFNDQLLIIEQVRGGLFKTYGAPDPRNMSQLKCLPVIEEMDEEGKVKTDADGNPIMIPNTNFPKFASEMNELMNQEIEMVFNKVTLPETLEIEPSTLVALEKFIRVN